MKQHTRKFETKLLAGAFNLSQLMALMFALVLLAAFKFALAAAPTNPIDPAAVLADEKFDHVKTGFNLTGAHATARCVTCHINNVLKGTPRECASCHIAGNRMSATAKPTTNHLITNEQCGTCHKTSLWSPAFFSHVGIATGTCKTCHNGSQASGLPRGHTTTNSSCDSCHKTTDWLQAAFSHKGIINGCSTCHGQTFQGSTPTAKPARHMVTAADCSDCHITTSFVTLKPGANIPLPSGHFTTTQQCGLCHSGASFVPGIMNHLGIGANCETCHGGQTFTVNGVSVTPLRKQVPPHMVTSLPCASCHTSTTSFILPANAILPMPSGHLPSLKPCSTCHVGNNFGPDSGVMSHVGIFSGCSSCHNGQSFTVVGQQGQSATPLSKPTGPNGHIPTSAACENCHSPSMTTSGNFSLYVMNHTGITSNCASCHSDGMSFTGVMPKSPSDVQGGHLPMNGLDCSSCHVSTTTFKGASGVALPGGHLPTSQPCSICHTNGYGQNSGSMSHVGIINNCNTCHNGQTFTVNGISVTPMRKQDKPTPPVHIDTPLDCSTCHSSTATFTGAISTVMPASHIPTTRTCTTCHSPGSVTMNHAGITSNCSQCHNGQSFYGNGSSSGLHPVSKANFSTHVATSSDCFACHYPSPNGYTSFAGASGGAMPLNHLPTNQPCTLCHAAGYGIGLSIMNHIGITSGCASCHNGQTFAVGMRPTSKASTSHVPTSLPCESCHSSSSTSRGGFKGATMNHTGIVNGCDSCHFSGNSFGALAKPGNHIPYATQLLGGSTMKCEFCHTNTSPGGFSPMNASSTKMHNGSQGKGSGWCKGCHDLSGTSFLGVRGRKSLTHESSGHTDCSDSGCHRPLGNEGSTYNSW